MRKRTYVMAEILVPVALVATWWMVSEGSVHPFWPSLTEIWAAFRQEWLTGARLQADLVPSLTRMSLGFVVSLVLGITIGTAIGLSARVRQFVDPVLQFMRAIPPPALIPVALLFFGLADSGKVFLIVLGAIWPVVLSTEDGVRSVEPTLKDVAAVYRLTPWQRLRTVIIPYAGPHIFAGLRTCLAISLLLMVVSEMVAARNGLGHFIIQSQRTLDITSMWSGMLVLGLFGYALNAVFLVGQRRVLRWHPDFRKGGRD